MKVGCLTIIALSGIIIQSIEAVWVYKGSFNDKKIEFSLVDSKTADCNKNAIGVFTGPEGAICFEHAPWNKQETLKSGNEKLYENIDDQRIFTLLAYYSRFVGEIDIEDDADALLSSISPVVIKNFTALFSEKALRTSFSANSFKDALPLFAKMIPNMTTNQISNLSTDLISAVIKNETDQRSLRSVLNVLTPSKIDDLLDVIIDKVVELGQLSSNSDNNLRLWKLNDNLLKKLLARDDFCTKVSYDQMLTLGERVKKATLVSPKCFAMVNFENAKCDVRIRYFPPQVFNAIEKELSKSCYELFTGSIVESYGRGLSESADRCKTLQIHNLTFEAAKSIDSNCLFNRFASEEDSAHVKLNGTWGILSSKILSVFSEEGKGDTITNINSDDYRYITMEQKEYLLASNYKVCEHLPSEFFYTNGNFEIRQDCFELLPDETKGAAFLYAKLPEQALSKITTFKDWKVSIGTDSNGDQVIKNGIEILEEAAHVPNIEQLIKNISIDDPNSHACGDIEDIEKFKEFKVLQEYCSKSCVEALGKQPSITDLGELNPRIGSLIRLEDLLQELDANEKIWDGMSVDLFKVLTSHEGFCSHLSTARVNNLNEEFLAEITAQCAADLTVWNELDQTVITHFKPDAFQLITAGKVKVMNVDLLTDDQFGELGIKVSADKHPAIDWTKESISKLSPARVSRIKIQAWTACPAEAYAGLTAEMFKVIPASAMENMSANQVSNISPEAIKQLSGAQAHDIGKELDNTETSPLKILREAPLPEAALNIISTRIAELTKSKN